MATCGRFNKNYESLLTVLKEYDILPLYIILVLFLYPLSMYFSHYQLLFIDSFFVVLFLFLRVFLRSDDIYDEAVTEAFLEFGPDCCQNGHC